VLCIVRHVRLTVGVSGIRPGPCNSNSGRIVVPAGATLYIEPAELLELNNREAQLADQESQAELAVLQVGLFQEPVCVCAFVRLA
jgi:hypothetical protein